MHKGFDYGRSHNPTRFALERCVADLEGGTQAFAFASGLAAIATVLELLDAGAHVVCGDDLYGGTFRLFEQGAPAQRRACASAIVDLTDLARCEAALPADTKLVWVETPTNPLLQARRPRARSPRSAARAASSAVADNTFASPYVQRPLELGFDIVVHSTTKYLNGHSDVIGGVAVVGADERRADARAAGLPAERGRRDRRARSTASSRCAASRRWRCAWSATARTRSRSRTGSKRSRRSRACTTRACHRTRSTRSRKRQMPRLRRHDLARPEDRPRRRAALSRSGAASSRSPRAWAASKA